MLNQDPLNTKTLNASPLVNGITLICRILNTSTVDSAGVIVLRKLLVNITGATLTPTMDITKYVALVISCINSGQATMTSVYTLINLITNVVNTSEISDLSDDQIQLIRNLNIIALNISNSSDDLSILLGYIFSLILHALNTQTTTTISPGAVVRALYPEIINVTSSEGSYELIHRLLVSIQNTTEVLTLAPAELLLVTWISLTALADSTTDTLDYNIVRSLSTLIDAVTESTSISLGAVLRELTATVKGISVLTDVTPIFLNAIQIIFRGLNASSTSIAALVPLIKLAFRTFNVTASSSTIVSIARELKAYVDNNTESLDITAGFIKQLSMLVQNTSATKDDLVLLLILILASSSLGFAKPEPSRDFEKPVLLYNYVKQA